MAQLKRKQLLQDFWTRALLESTRKIIAAQGFDAVTMDRVAREAGMAKGGIYLYFANKQQMVLTAIEEIASQMLGQIENRVDSKEEPWEKLCQLVRAQMKIMEQHRDLLRTLLLDRRLLRDSPGGKQTRRLLRFRERHESHIQKILAEGIRKKVFVPLETARAAFYINEITISTIQKRVLGLSRMPLEREVEGVLRFIGLLASRKNRNFGKPRKRS